MTTYIPSYDKILGRKPNTQQTQDYLNTPVSESMLQMASNLNSTSPAPSSSVTQQQPNSTPAESSTRQTQIQTTTGEPASTQQKPMSYAEMFVAMNPYRPQTPEERAEEAKRNRRNAMFAAISDGISALSNLYFTTKGAPNSFNGGNTLSGKLYERQRQLMKDQEAREKEYLNGYIRALEMDRRQASDERNWRLKVDELKYKRKRDAADDARKEAKEERDKALHDLNMKLTQGKINEQQYKAAVQETNAEYADAMAKEKLNSQKALTNQRNASAAAAYARANGGGGSGRGTKLIPITTPDGKKAYNLPENVVKNSKLLEGAIKAADISLYTGAGNRKKKDTKELWGEVLASERGQEYLENVAKWSGGDVLGITEDYVPDDRYSDYEISAPSVDEDDELDFDSMIMN